MAEAIRITMKDGTIKDFKHVPRSGGSWTLSGKYEPGFYVVIDEYGNQTAIPTADIADINVRAERSW